MAYAHQKSGSLRRKSGSIGRRHLPPISVRLSLPLPLPLAFSVALTF